MRLFDSHCHLQDHRIEGEIVGIMERAKLAGVDGFLCCGSSEQDWNNVIELCQKYHMIIPAFGIHPWNVAQRSKKWFDRLESILKKFPHAAVGEIGLDHALENRNDREQLNVFSDQLNLARKLNRVVSIHCRRAWGDLLAVLKNMNESRLDGAIHSYSGPAQLVTKLQSYGFFISFSGSITHNLNRKAVESLLKVDLKRLLIESDTPDMVPVGFAGFNEPANMIFTINRISEVLGKDKEEMAELTYQNGLRLFKR